MNLSLAERVDVLFCALHSPDEGEPTGEFVAAALRDRGIEVSADELTALRGGSAPRPSTELLTAVARHFNQEPWFLVEAGDTPRVVDAYVQLDLLRALREAGVRRVRLRGRPATFDRRALTESLRTRREHQVEPSCAELPSAAADPA
ncbi:hypothetical protein OHB12_04850 [Nocardia sp. NBC_01730]|uniref:hypothetical protein n=1 Tax=Nocardia sp. NBC_01730 TaxID=2975998 RepID=UPI002E13C19B|nr:hypothetical protein OHB12_04850 [Nocardia sp. NBC_01730]